jgi:dienelactone hydrolase
MTTLTAEDTHKLAAYRATPADAPRGALVVVQEIWDRIKKAHPTLPMHVYPGAGHGFSCDERGSFHEPSHKLARERTIAFLRQHVG